MAGDITVAGKAARQGAAKYGVTLSHSDGASMANAVHCGGPLVDSKHAVEDYLRRNHAGVHLTDEQLADLGAIVYKGLRGII